MILKPYLNLQIKNILMTSIYYPLNTALHFIYYYNNMRQMDRNVKLIIIICYVLGLRPFYYLFFR